MAEENRRIRDALLTRLKETVDQVASDRFMELSLHQLLARLQRFKEKFRDFEDKNEIAAKDIEAAADRQAFMDQFSEFEEVYLDTIAHMTERIEHLTAQDQADRNQAAAAGQANPNALNQAAQVFQLTMPFMPHTIVDTWGKFNGDQLAWCDFKERFMLGVHSVDEMPEAYKIQHLRNALTGEAAASMSGHTLVGGNYAMLWEALNKKYDKKYATACAYLTKFYSLPKMNEKEMLASELKRMVNVTNEMIRQLRSMEYPVDGYDLILVHALQARMNKHCAQKWNEKRKDNDHPTLNQVLEFLDAQVMLHATQNLMNAPLKAMAHKDRASDSSHRHESSSEAKTTRPCPICPDGAQ